MATAPPAADLSAKFAVLPKHGACAQAGVCLRYSSPTVLPTALDSGRASPPGAKFVSEAVLHRPYSWTVRWWWLTRRRDGRTTWCGWCTPTTPCASSTRQLSATSLICCRLVLSRRPISRMAHHLSGLPLAASAPVPRGCSTATRMPVMLWRTVFAATETPMAEQRAASNGRLRVAATVECGACLGFDIVSLSTAAFAGLPARLILYA